MIHSYKDLIVWQKSVDLVTEIYKVTKDFPKDELYGIVSQMRRSSISIPSNIAEGRKRGTRKDFKHFLQMSYGSTAELETQLIISRNLEYINDKDLNELIDKLTEIMKMLNKMIRSMSKEI